MTWIQRITFCHTWAQGGPPSGLLLRSRAKWRGNGTWLTCSRGNAPDLGRPRHGPYTEIGPELGLRVRAGDENRTRTISLGTKPERPLSPHPCYSCTSGPPRCPADAPEYGPIRTVCETSVRRGAR